MSELRETLWNQLRAAGLVSGDTPPAAEAVSPWYLRTMLGLAGWLAALFLVGFLFVLFESLLRDAAAAIGLGLAAIAAGYGLLRRGGSNEFADQFGLAVSFAGQAVLAVGVFDAMGRHHAASWFVLALVQALLAIVVPSVIHRLWSGYAAATALALGLNAAGVYQLTGGLLAAATAAVWLNEPRWAHYGATVRPAGYGLTVALVQFNGTLLGPGFFGISTRQSMIEPWMGAALVGATLVAVVWRQLARAGLEPGDPRTLAALGTSALVAVVSLEAWGIAAALLIILLGFAGRLRVLCSLGAAALLFYVSAYYYTLETTLLAKAQLLATLGMVLLAARWAQGRWLSPNREVHHA